ncbi:MAG: hypothetical protein EPO28_06155 [Saprospiraceae bacterium]|nr:MAG: hypothetical protein EPO28_06155 [Saprospiraceae bacterium]
MRKLIPLAFLFVFFNSSLFGQDGSSPKEGFTTNFEEEHYLIFVLANRPNDLPEVRAAITKYIWKYYPQAHLKVTQIAVDGDLANVPLIHLAAFKDKAQAMEFYNNLKKNRPDFLQMGMTLDYFPLSKSNYEAILRAKSLDGYKTFFQTNY